MGLIKLLIFAGLICALGCGQGVSSMADSIRNVDTIPEKYENPSGTPELSSEKVSAELAPESKTQTETTQPTLPTSLPEVTPFIENAEWVMTHEGKRIGTPCNLYVLRVLKHSGFSKDSFMANDFDRYAKKNFRHYKAVDFKSDKSGSDLVRLRKHIWSFPERTPFILQWSGAGPHGHIAILERIADHLIIYQAQLKKATAHREQTTIESLLSGYDRRTLTVYSDFIKN